MYTSFGMDGMEMDEVVLVLVLVLVVVVVVASSALVCSLFH